MADSRVNQSRFFPLGQNGEIVNDTSSTHVSEQLCHLIVDYFVRQFPDAEALKSVYIRGSVARGTFVPGISDLDAFAVLQDGYAGPDLEADKTLLTKIKQTLPGVTEIELTHCHESEVIGNPLGVWPFFIKTQSLNIWGTDYAHQLADYKPGCQIMGEAMWLPNRLLEYQQRLNDDKWKGREAFLCEWIMKAVVRAAFELTMETEKRYTRDLDLCYQVFSRHYPEYSEMCHQAMVWAVSPDNDTRAHLQLVEKFSLWIERKLARILSDNLVDVSRYDLAAKGS
ncbi:hypothetical protein ACP51X_001666 [Vibrio vulnificus]